MSFAIGQLRKSTSQEYMTPIEVTASTITSPNTFGQTGNDFTDFALAGTFSPGIVYYLRFKVHKIPEYFYAGIDKNRVAAYLEDADTLSLSIILKNSTDIDEEKNPPELIGTCKVSKAKWNEPEEYSTFSFVFTPSKQFDRVGFRVNRVSYDAIETTEGRKRNWMLTPASEADVSVQRWNQSGEQITVESIGPRIYFGNEGDNADFCSLVSLVPDGQSWLKFGYQSRPGNLIVVNKQPIRVGRSGIYEINNGTDIDEFMIASPGGRDNSKIDAFLLDYAYDNG